MNTNKLTFWMIVWICMAMIHLIPTPVNSSRSIYRHVDRLALVIGNAEYTKAGRLLNPVNDARDMAQKLEALDFVVRLLTNATQREMEDAIRQFGKELSQEGVGLFYFAGHG